MDGRQTEFCENRLEILMLFNVKEYLGNHPARLREQSTEIYSEPIGNGCDVALSKLDDGWLTIRRDSFDHKFAPKFGKIEG